MCVGEEVAGEGNNVFAKKSEMLALVETWFPFHTNRYTRFQYLYRIYTYTCTCRYASARP